MDDGPPVNFQNVHDEQEKIRCKLCQVKRSKFICATCINTGNFHHSTSFLKDSFKEKQLKLKNNNTASQIWHVRAQVVFEKQRAHEVLLFSIKKAKRNIECAKKAIQERKDEIEKAKKTLKEKTKYNQMQRRKLVIFQNKCQEEDGIYQAKKELIQMDKYVQLADELKKVVRFNVSQLVKYIFPIQFILESQDSFGEASRTVMVKGKWLAHPGNGGNYMIVAPYLPADGDYQIYKDWVMTNRHDTNDTTYENLVTKSSHRIFGALMYTSQLVKIIAYYLDVRLPFKGDLNDFGSFDLQENEFNRRVAKLNANILYLCYKQHVDLNTLDPMHTLENLYKLLVEGVGDLGHIGYCDRDKCFSHEEDQKMAQYLNESGSDDSEEGNLAGEWEALPDNSPHVLPHRAPVQPMQSSFVQSFSTFFRWGK